MAVGTENQQKSTENQIFEKGIVIRMVYIGTVEARVRGAGGRATGLGGTANGLSRSKDVTAWLLGPHSASSHAKIELILIFFQTNQLTAHLILVECIDSESSIPIRLSGVKRR